MSGTTSVPQISYTDQGFVAPAESAIVTGLDADWNAAFGGNLNTDPSTPQGQLIASQAAMLGDNYDLQTLLFNSVDPAFASGRMQDAIARIYFLTRPPAQSTVLEIACSGGTGVVIPVGASISDPAGNLYLCTQATPAGGIPASGSVTLMFASAVMAPIAVPASVSIYQTIPGWNTVSVASGVVGNLALDRASFEALREATVAANGAGFLPAIAGAIATVPGVLDWYVTENPTGSPVTIGGVSVAAHSMYACVAGGAAQAVANAIWTKKNPGCGMVGTTTETVQDTNSGYSPPYPSYSISFQIPTAEPICMTVTLTNSAAVPSNAAVLVQTAVQSAFLGQDGGTRARIGSTIYASRFYAGIASLGSWALIVSIQIGTEASPAATFTGAISGTALTVSAVTGTIAIGQFVYGVGVQSGTVITAGSGTSWTVAVSQTVSAEAMNSVNATSNDVTMQINQIPTLAPADVNLVLQ
jgi:hypothetical protein